MQGGPMDDERDGSYRHDWKPTVAENPNYQCRHCGSRNVWYRRWDSNDGAYEDIAYECRACGRRWWFESIDS